MPRLKIGLWGGLSVTVSLLAVIFYTHDFSSIINDGFIFKNPTEKKADQEKPPPGYTGTDPSGYIINEFTGLALSGTSVTATAPVGGSWEFLLNNPTLYDGSLLRVYSWSATGTPIVTGTYTMSVSSTTSGYQISPTCAPSASAYTPVGGSTISLGQPITLAPTGILDIRCANNPSYYPFILDNTSPAVQYNHIFLQPLSAPSLCSSGTVTGTIFVDRNVNGVYDAGTDIPRPHVYVSAYDANNALIDQCRTTQEGLYAFSVTSSEAFRIEVSSTTVPYPPFTWGIPSTSVYSPYIFGTAPASALDSSFVTSTGYGYNAIGNRVWLDLNGNGRQDAGEEGFSGVQVQLYQGTYNSGSLVGTATTSAIGEFYFGGPSAQNMSSGNVVSSTAYYLVIQGTSVNGGGVTYSRVNSAAALGNSELDSASAEHTASGSYQTFTVGAGVNNYSYDFGFTTRDMYATTTPSSTTASAGETVVVTIDYGNRASLSVTSIEIAAVVPTGTTFVSASSSAGWTCSDGATAGTLCMASSTPSTFTYNTTGTIDFAVQIESGASFPIYVNPYLRQQQTICLPPEEGGCIGGVPYVGDHNILNNTATTTISEPSGGGTVELALTNTANTSTVVAGNTALFTLGYTNNGTATATGVTISHTVPTGTTYVAGSSTGSWSCSDGATAGTACNATIGSVAASATGTVIFAAQAVSGYTGTITSTASITDDGASGADTSLSNNTATTTITATSTPAAESSPAPSSGGGGIVTQPPLAVEASLRVIDPCRLQGELLLRASGMTRYIVGTDAAFTNAQWIDIPRVTNRLSRLWNFSGVGIETIYVRVQNNAGNMSDVAVLTETVDTSSCSQVDPLMPPSLEEDEPQEEPLEEQEENAVGGSVCEFRCDEISYDVYIVTPEGEERHSDSSFVQRLSLFEVGSDRSQPDLGIERIMFEDSSNIDSDFNDVVLEVTKNCGSGTLVVEMISVSASWEHQIRIRVFRDGVEQDDILLWENSHEAAQRQSGRQVIVPVQQVLLACRPVLRLDACPVCQDVRSFLYIVGRDGRERYMSSQYSRVESRVDGYTRVSFEDGANLGDRDFNDVILDMKKSCDSSQSNVRFVSYDAQQRHQVRVKYFARGREIDDQLVWRDVSRATPERNVSFEKSLQICKEKRTLSVDTTDESLSCVPPYLTSFIHEGGNNDPRQVRKLQNFLRIYEGFDSVITTGIYNRPTYAAVVQFQERYAEDILAPWNLRKGTGWVYLTTRKKINEQYCLFSSQ